MSKNLIGYFRRSTVSMAAAIALSMGTVYLSIKGDMSSAMGAAGAATKLQLHCCRITETEFIIKIRKSATITNIGI
jgi:hypothetical protein